MIRGGDAWHCRILQKITGMQFDFSLNPSFDFSFYDEVIGKLVPDPDTVFCQGVDFAGQRIRRSTTKTRERVEHHFKIWQKYTNQLPVLEDIFAFCKASGFHLILSDAPVRSDYAAALKEMAQGADTLSDIRKTAEKNGITLIEPTGFRDEDFSDSDHLNFNGALKLTRQLSAYLQ